jgi:hypothetical protein
LDLSVLTLAGETYLLVRLRDEGCADVFATLADDVAIRVARSQDTRESARILLARLHRWQLFLTASRNTLGLEAQRGLYGEMHVLLRHLIPSLPAFAAVSSWKASDASHQDFQFPSGAIEVKTTSAKRPHTIRITSERQLDGTGVGSLYLHVLVVDEREVPSDSGGTGLTLPEIIAQLRACLAAEPQSASLFDDYLLHAGWVDSAASHYESRRWTIRREQTFQVADRFPRITETMLPAGIGDVSYALDLEACSEFAMDIATVLAALAGGISFDRTLATEM